MKMKTLVEVFGYLLAVILAISFMYGMWQFSRVWNYNLSYKSMVEKTVREMVKEEYLKGVK